MRNRDGIAFLGLGPARSTAAGPLFSPERPRPAQNTPKIFMTIDLPARPPQTPPAIATREAVEPRDCSPPARPDHQQPSYRIALMAEQSLTTPRAFLRRPLFSVAAVVSTAAATGTPGPTTPGPTAVPLSR
jgi:hypothetical protein